MDRADFEVRLYNETGVLQAVVPDYTHLGYGKRVADLGVYEFGLPVEHPVVPLLAHPRWQVEVRRRLSPSAHDWATDFWGLTERLTIRHDGERELAISRGRDLLSVLTHRLVCYRAGTYKRSTFDATAPDIARLLVYHNLGPGATVSEGRLIDGVHPFIVVPASTPAGAYLSVSCAYDNLFSALQKLARSVGAEFDIERAGPTEWVFRWYPEGMGTDRSADVLFALELGNMADPEYDLDVSTARTVAVAAGQGEGKDRAVSVLTGNGYAPGNGHSEVFADGRSISSTSGLELLARRALAENERRETLNFTVLQTEGCRYGVHYHLGDKVAARYRDIWVQKRVAAVTVTVDDGGENTAVELV